MKTPTKILKALSMMAVAALMMGNEGCENNQTEESSARPRRIVDIGKIEARPVQLPNGQMFDLDYVLNQQFPDVLIASNEYAVLRRNMTFAYGEKDENIMHSMGASAQEWHYSKEAACLVNLPQFRINGVVNSYEWITGGGATIGYSPTGDLPVGNISGTVTIERAQMDLTLRAKHSILDRIIEVANITKDQIKTAIKFSVSFGQINIGPEFYHQKGLAQVSKEALEKALAKLRTRTDNKEWYTRVGARHENFVTIIGGQDVKLKRGDKVSIHNSLYYWQDNRICEPDAFRGDLHGDAIAYGVVDEVGEIISRVKIDQASIGAEDPLVGSVVKIMKLVDAPSQDK